MCRKLNCTGIVREPSHLAWAPKCHKQRLESMHSKGTVAPILTSHANAAARTARVSTFGYHVLISIFLLPLWSFMSLLLILLLLLLLLYFCWVDAVERTSTYWPPPNAATIWGYSSYRQHEEVTELFAVLAWQLFVASMTARGDRPSLESQPFFWHWSVCCKH